jgi:hypothetical protein
LYNLQKKVTLHLLYKELGESKKIIIYLFFLSGIVAKYFSNEGPETSAGRTEYTPESVLRH